MKYIIVCFVISAFLHVSSPNHINYSFAVKNSLRVDTINAFKYSCEKFKKCQTDSCVRATISEVKSFTLTSYILVRQLDDNRWVIEKDTANYINFLSSPKIKSVSVGEGNIVIADKAYPDKARFVAIR